MRKFSLEMIERRGGCWEHFGQKASGTNDGLKDNRLLKLSQSREKEKSVT